MNDYALQVVPEVAKEWGWVSISGVMLGCSTAMFFFLLGGQVVQMYGTKYLIIGAIIATFAAGSIGFILSIIASETGLDIDLITSGSGFGYKGAGITSLIYASSYVIYFAIEGSIISEAIHSQLPMIPLVLLYIIVCAIFVFLTWYGITSINYLMWLSLPIYLVILIFSIYKVLHLDSHINFLTFKPLHSVDPQGGPVLLQMLALLVGPVIAGALAMTDIARFIPKKKKMIGAFSISYLVSLISFLGVYILGAWFGFRIGQNDPGMYFPAMLGLWGVIFVIISQMRINMVNAYSGSLAFTTFFSRIFNLNPGRAWWIILLAILSVVMMFFNILDHMESVFSFFAMFIVSWTMAVLSYILFNKKLFKISPRNFQFKRDTIPNYNPIGLTSLAIALLVGVPMELGAYGPLLKTLAPFIAATSAFVCVPIIGILFKNHAKH